MGNDHWVNRQMDCCQRQVGYCPSLVITHRFGHESRTIADETDPSVQSGLALTLTVSRVRAYRTKSPIIMKKEQVQFVVVLLVNNLI